MDSDLYTFQATVATGFESVLCEEILRKIPSVSLIRVEKGRVFFTIEDSSFDVFSKVFSLKGADNLSFVLIKEKELAFSNEKEADLHTLTLLPKDIDWKSGLNIWLRTIHRENPLMQNIQYFAQENCLFYNSSNIVLEDILAFPLSTSNECANRIRKNLSFRVTCYRNGQNHSFTSREAAAAFGGTIKDDLNWTVDLKNYEVEILLYINDSSYYVCIGLTRMSLHYRNITVFGKLSLRPTVAYNILGLATIELGDIVCDPMAGFGTIPIEAAMEYPGNVILCGDINYLAVKQCAKNVAFLNKKLELNCGTKLNLSTFRWNAYCLPLRNNSVDVFVSDLPFGKCCGRKSSLPYMYQNVVREMTRICRTKTGRCILLVMNKKILSQAIGKFKEFWLTPKVVPVKLGNLKTKVCVYNRTEKPFSFK